jgi:hypothetical protein
MRRSLSFSSAFRKLATVLSVCANDALSTGRAA